MIHSLDLFASFLDQAKNEGPVRSKDFFKRKEVVDIFPPPYPLQEGDIDELEIPYCSWNYPEEHRFLDMPAEGRSSQR